MGRIDSMHAPSRISYCFVLVHCTQMLENNEEHRTAILELLSCWLQKNRYSKSEIKHKTNLKSEIKHTLVYYVPSLDNAIHISQTGRMCRQFIRAYMAYYYYDALDTHSTTMYYVVIRILCHRAYYVPTFTVYQTLSTTMSCTHWHTHSRVSVVTRLASRLMYMNNIHITHAHAPCVQTWAF